jgi:hypothetical protein
VADKVILGYGRQNAIYSRSGLSVVAKHVCFSLEMALGAIDAIHSDLIILFYKIPLSSLR